MKVGVVIVCAGEGKRLGAIEKATVNLGGKPLFYHAVSAFRSLPQVKHVVLVLKRNHFTLAERIIKDKKVICVQGGKERKDSVYNGLCALSEDIDYVLVHDGARALVKRKVVAGILKALKKYPAVVCGLRARDTLKLVNDSKVVMKTLDRNNIVSIQTPQGFKKKLLLSAYSKFRKRKSFDDAQVVEELGYKIKVVDGDIRNFKITYPEDLKLAKVLIEGYRKKKGPSRK